MPKLLHYTNGYGDITMKMRFAEQKPSTNYVFANQRIVGRIAGDSPDGLVLVGGAPAIRNVDIFDRTLKTHIATTTSNSSGEYEFLDQLVRDEITNVNGDEGYDVILRGVIASGERDVIIPGIQPVT